MMHIHRVMRRPLAVATAGAAAALLTIGGSVAAVAAPKAHHRSGRTRHAATHRSRHDASPSSGLSIGSVPWGSVGGQPVNLYTLHNSHGMTVKISNYGGVVQSIWVPNADGSTTNVALGFPKLSDYVNDFTQGATQTPFPAAGGSGDTYFGAIIGRYANRIAAGKFSLNGTTYQLDVNNNGTTSLHGGYLGWNTAVWTPSTSSTRRSVSLTLTSTFPAGEGCLASLSPGCTGYPAAVKATVTYTLTRDNQLKIGYQALNLSSSLATVINLTNHTYFNLGGEGNDTVYNQLLALNSDAYTPVNTSLIPEAPFFVPVAGTAYDFRSMHKIGKNIRNTNLPDGESGPLTQLQIAHGYDNNWVLNGYGTNNTNYRLAAVAQDPKNGVVLRAYTDQPGVQVYSGNFLVGDLIGTSGNVYRQGDAFTLETQDYPDAPNHQGQAGWPSAVLNPGATFTTNTAFAFAVQSHSLAGQVQFP
jgi:aldose 1-epimerase